MHRWFVSAVLLAASCILSGQERQDHNLTEPANNPNQPHDLKRPVAPPEKAVLMLRKYMGGTPVRSAEWQDGLNLHRQRHGLAAADFQVPSSQRDQDSQAVPWYKRHCLPTFGVAAGFGAAGGYLISDGGAIRKTGGGVMIGLGAVIAVWAMQCHD